MNRTIRCRRCGSLFALEQFDVVTRWRRLCPRCRGPLPPTGGVLARDDRMRLPSALVQECAS